MKAIRTLLPVVLMACLCIVFSACEKVLEYLDENPTADIKYCNITKFTENSGPSGSRIATFTYNVWGNPTKITVTNVGTGNPNRIFKYDSYNRLKEYRGEYTNGNYEYWYRYDYDPTNNRIVSDTVYIFGAITPEPTTYFDRRVTHYTYDAQGRITQTSTVSTVFPGPPVVQNYTYDAAGNKVVPGITYDSKVNLHRTNKVWMFLDRDYSLNNPLTADSYNLHGLPLSITLPAESPLRGFIGFYLNDSDIEYKCD
ncbi:MAG TPA: hypothetical protein VD996_16650 [Chitinophagaceae bacterium]|nr:hypothetical protein [Chitinophagaceae bacterium]